MEEEKFVKDRRRVTGTNEGGWSPGMGQLLGLVLSLILLIAAIVLGVTTGLGIIFAVPVGVVALAIAFLVLRGRSSPETKGVACPHCGARVPVASHIAEVGCPSCGKQIEVGGAGAARGV